MDKRLAVLAVAVATAVPLSSRAACMPPLLSPSSTPQYVFMVSVVKTMSLAMGAMARVDPAKPPAVNELLYRAKLAAADYRCASRLMEPFAQAKDDATQIAGVLGSLYNEQADIADAGVQVLVEMMNSGGSVQPGDVANQMATLRANSDASWSSIMQ